MTCVAHIVAAPEFARLILRHELRHHGTGATHVIIASPGPDLDALEAEGFQVERVSIQRKLSPGADLISVVRLIGTLRRVRPDLLHTYTPKAGLLGQIAAAAVRIPRRVHGCRGLLYRPGLPAWRRWLFRQTDRLTCALAQRVLFVSKADLNRLVDDGLCLETKARLTGNGIDLLLFGRNARYEQERAATRAELGFRGDQVVVLTVGRFVADKGFLDLAAAIKRLKTPLSHLRFLWVAPVIAGEGAALPSDLYDRAPLDSLVTRLSRRDDMRQIYQAADLLIHPSHREGTPRVLMEAAANGLPILASDIPGNREVVEFGRSARAFPCMSPEGLAAALDQMLADPSSWGPMADAARAEVFSRMDVTAVAGRVEGVYRELGLSIPMTQGEVASGRI